MKMTRVRVEGFTISLDGYGAGPNQDIRNPLGVGGTDLHQWLVPTRTLQRTLFGADGGTTGIDDDFAARGFKNVGAWILGRNMFGPIRGSWPDMNWKGWWGDNPPYHVPTFILTHHARAPIQMEGGTTFYFVTGGIHEALDRARDDTLARLGKRGAELVGEVVQYEDTYRLCYIRGPEGILIGLAQELGQQTSR
jgi:dihydrofolate reductase